MYLIEKELNGNLYGGKNMKMTSKRVLSILIAIVLIFGLSVPAFAAEPKNDDSISVGCIGDSIPNGASLYPDKYTMACATPSKAPYTGNSAYQDLRDQYQYVEGYNDALPESDPANLAVTLPYEKTLLRSYGLQVAMGLNLTDDEIAQIDTFDEFRAAVDYRSMTANAMRSMDILTLFDDEYKAKLASEGFDACWYNPEVESIHRLFTKQYITDCICGTADTEPLDLLIYAFGNNDFIYGPIVNADAVSEDEQVKTKLVEVATGLADFVNNTPKILDKFQELNPTMEIILVGVYNPYFTTDLSAYKLSLSEDAIAIIMDAVTAATATINLLLREQASTRSNVTFVDVNGLEALEVDENGNTISGDGVHPSVNGQDYIASRVLSAVPASLKDKGKYDLTVNLFGVYDPNDAGSRIVSVTVDGKPVTYYELKGYNLTIHCKTPFVKLVNVTTYGKKIGNTTWQASYNLTDGYRTYQILRVSDVVTTIINIFSIPVTAIKNIFKMLTKS